MEVHHVVPRIHEEASGPSYSVPALCNALSQTGVETHLHVLQQVPERPFSCTIHSYPHALPPKRLGISPAMRLQLVTEAATSDIIHNHSLWMMPNIYAAQAASANSCRLVLSPRGTLQPWSLRRHRWRKRCIWLLGQRKTVQQAALIHATAENELYAIRALGLKTPVAVVPNGIDIPEERPLPSSGRRKRVLFFGRIHPVKGVDMLINVWPRIQSRFPDWELHITGPDTNGQTEKMQNLAAAVAARRIVFSGAKYGREKSDTFRRAALYVLPSHTENFGLTVAESLAHGVPAITTTGTPWARLEEEACGWWVERKADTLESALVQAMSLSDGQRKLMGQRGRQWMRREFSWSTIAEKMRSSYAWLLGGGNTPNWIDTVSTRRSSTNNRKAA